MIFHYVYILQSESHPKRYYTGYTTNLKERLAKHNAGAVPHTSTFVPWRLKTAVAFTEKEKATQFELYLKSPSGRAFARKRL